MSLKPFLAITKGLYCMAKLFKTAPSVGSASQMAHFIQKVLCHFYSQPMSSMQPATGLSGDEYSLAEAEELVKELLSGFDSISTVLSGCNVDWKKACPSYATCVSLLMDTLKTSPSLLGDGPQDSCQGNVGSCLNVSSSVRDQLLAVLLKGGTYVIGSL